MSVFVVAIATVGLAAFVAGVFLLSWSGGPWQRGKFELTAEDRRSLGSALLTGAVVSVLLTLLQVNLDRQRQNEDKREQFRLSVGASHDLSGFDPAFELAGMTLSGKIMDRAELSGEDLSNANLSGASLRDANLAGADLEGANLSRADLAGARLWDANLRGADLTFANLSQAGLQRPGANKQHLDLHGAEVNARTCWPTFLLATGRLRGQLTRTETFVLGQKRAEESFGTACGLSYVDLLLHFRGSQPIRLGDLANKLGLRPSRVRDVIEAGGQSSPAAFGRRGVPVIARTGACIGSRRVLVRHRPHGGSTALLVSPAKGQVAATAVVLDPDETTHFKPLEPGTTVTLIATDSTKTNARKYLAKTRVQRCRSHRGADPG